MRKFIFIALGILAVYLVFVNPFQGPKIYREINSPVSLTDEQAIIKMFEGQLVPGFVKSFQYGGHHWVIQVDPVHGIIIKCIDC